MFLVDTLKKQEELIKYHDMEGREGLLVLILKSEFKYISTSGKSLIMRVYP